MLTVNNIKPFSGAMDMQEWVPVALLLSYKIFHTVVSNVNLCIYVNCPILLSNFQTKFLVYANDISILVKKRYRNPETGLRGLEVSGRLGLPDF
jgi:hypothetical protein